MTKTTTVRTHNPDVRYIVEELRARIADQRLPPGARLREQDLAGEFGVARAKIRDALTLLQSRGLIERIPNRGAVVTRLDLSQVSHIYDIREVLEGLAVRLATEHEPPSAWQDLVELFGEPMDRHVRESDFDAFLDCFATFQRRVVGAASNPLLAEMLESIHEKTQVIMQRIIILPGRAEIGLVEHRAVLAAMRKGDAETAERLKRDNLRSAKGFLRRFERFVL